MNSSPARFLRPGSIHHAAARSWVISVGQEATSRQKSSSGVLSPRLFSETSPSASTSTGCPASDPRHFLRLNQFKYPAVWPEFFSVPVARLFQFTFRGSNEWESWRIRTALRQPPRTFRCATLLIKSGRPRPALVGEAEPNEEAVQFLRAPVKTTNGVVCSQLIDPQRITHGFDPPSKAVHLAVPPSALGGAATAFLAGIASALRRIRSGMRGIWSRSLGNSPFTESGTRFHRHPIGVRGRRR